MWLTFMHAGATLLLCATLAILSSACCLQGWMHCIHYVLCENAMGLVRLGAVVAGMRNSVVSGHML